jgi:hypothetical protein
LAVLIWFCFCLLELFELFVFKTSFVTKTTDLHFNFQFNFSDSIFVIRIDKFDYFMLFEFTFLKASFEAKTTDLKLRFCKTQNFMYRVRKQILDFAQGLSVNVFLGNK